MINLKELEKYLKYEFSTGWTTGEDYKIFEKKYINYLKSIVTKYKWEITKINKNHYEFSLFIKDENNKYIYLSIGDVRYFKNNWYYKILIRKAKGDNDYHGEKNEYCNLIDLPIKLHDLFKG